jgi:hypothetical protein
LYKTIKGSQDYIHPCTRLWDSRQQAHLRPLANIDSLASSIGHYIAKEASITRRSTQYPARRVACAILDHHAKKQTRAQCNMVPKKLLMMVSAIAVRAMPAPASECSQGACPDFSANFDFIQSFWQDHSSEHNIIWYTYDVRVKDRGDCVDTSTSRDGCVDFNSCGRDQNICMDYPNQRAHRIWKDNGHKTCYSMTTHWIGDCGLRAQPTITYPYEEVPCTW